MAAKNRSERKKKKKKAAKNKQHIGIIGQKKAGYGISEEHARRAMLCALPRACRASAHLPSRLRKTARKYNMA